MFSSVSVHDYNVQLYNVHNYNLQLYSVHITMYSCCSVQKYKDLLIDVEQNYGLVMDRMGRNYLRLRTLHLGRYLNL